MTADERAFRHLLLWYPRRWRRQHGEALLGALMDAADATGRDRPTAGERRSAALHGLSEHFDVRTGFVLAVLGTIAMIGATVLFTAAAPALSEMDVAWVMSVLSVAVGPALLAAAGLCLLAEVKAVVPLRVLLVCFLVLPTFAFAGLARIGGELAFDAADLGVAPEGPGRGWYVFFALALLCGTAATALVLQESFQRSIGSAPTATLLALLAGAATSLAVAFVLVSPAVCTLAGTALVVVAARLMRRAVRARPSSSPSGDRAPLGRDAEHARPLLPQHAVMSGGAGALVLVLTSASVGLVGVAYALTGTAWSVGSGDGTARMAHGITIGLAAGIPLLAAVGMRTSAGSSRHPSAIWGPLTSSALALAAAAAAYQFAPGWNAMAPWLWTSAVLLGTAVGWIVATRMRGAVGMRIGVGLVCGAGLAGSVGLVMVPVLAFAVPVIAIAMAVVESRSIGRARRSGALLPRSLRRVGVASKT